jgi:hypothetical protein
MLLIALSGACSNPILGDWATPEGPSLELTGVSVSPTTVHAGGYFVASASVANSSCDPVFFSVTYANEHSTGRLGDALLRAGFIAVLGQTAVHFSAWCRPTTGASPLDLQAERSTSIEVTPFP